MAKHTTFKSDVMTKHFISMSIYGGEWFGFKIVRMIDMNLYWIKLFGGRWIMLW